MDLDEQVARWLIAEVTPDLGTDVQAVEHFRTCPELRIVDSESGNTMCGHGTAEMWACDVDVECPHVGSRELFYSDFGDMDGILATFERWKAEQERGPVEEPKPEPRPRVEYGPGFVKFDL